MPAVPLNTGCYPVAMGSDVLSQDKETPESPWLPQPKKREGAWDYVRSIVHPKAWNVHSKARKR